MRILVFGLVGTNLGGIETFLLNMNEAMSKECIFDYVIEEEECIHIDRINKKGGKLYKVASRSKSPFKNLADIKKILQQHKADYSIVYFNLSSLSWLFPELIAHFMGYKIVVHSHNAMLIDANSDALHRVLNYINKFLLSKLNVYRVACSEYAAEFMFGKDKFDLVYNGIDIEKYRFSKRIRSEYRKLLACEDKVVVGVVGRLEYQKNPLFTIEIFKNIKQIIPNAYLVMIGDGKLKTDIETKIVEYELNDDVKLLGLVDNVHDYLNAFDMFLLPSRHEGLGIALIEAQTSGLPTITSKDVVPQEAVVTELISSCSLQADAVRWANECIDLLEQFGQVDREKYADSVLQTPYSIDVEAKRLEAIFSTLDKGL